ncbi:MAG: hypothetical protein JXR65_08500 [Bacteroidales bacterium]|nr:hypothetical protein [Bacteroidales bacterium]
MPKSFTPKIIQNNLPASKKEHTENNLKPSPRVINFLMAYSDSLQVIDSEKYGKQIILLN